jgi:membrane protein DedA with SNARE-associated domain
MADMDGLNYFLPTIGAWLAVLLALAICYFGRSINISRTLLLRLAESLIVLLIVLLLWILSTRSP